MQVKGERNARFRLTSLAGVLVLALALPGVSACGAGAPGQAAQVQTIDAQAVLDNDGALLVDVRTPDEYAAGHIPGAVNINSDQDEQALLAAFEEAGARKDESVILYCRTGRRASGVASTLASAGYSQIELYQGSWTDWTSDSNRPVATGADAGSLD